MQTPYAGNPYAPGQAPGREAKTPFQRRPAALGAATPTLPLALEGGPVRNESTTKRPTPAVTETPAQAAPTLLDVLLQQAATPAPRQAVGPARPEDLFRPELQTGQAYDAKALTPEARAAEDPLFWIVGNKQANPYTPPAAAGPQPRLGPQLGGGSGGVSSILQQLLGGNDIFSGSGQPPQNPRGGYDLPLPGGGTTPFFPGSPVNTPSGVPGSSGRSWRTTSKKPSLSTTGRRNGGLSSTHSRQIRSVRTRRSRRTPSSDRRGSRLSRSALLR